MTETAATTTTTEHAGASTETAVESVVDTPKLRKAILATVKKIRALRDQRAEINADIQAELESMVAKGIPKEALKRAIKDVDTDEDVRAATDTAYVVVRAALGKPTQMDAFAPSADTQH